MIITNIIVTVHTTGRNEQHEMRSKLKITVLIIQTGQDKAGQTHRNTGGNE